MLLNVIGRDGDAFSEVRRLLEDNHEPRSRQFALLRQALAIYRTLRTAGIVETGCRRPDPPHRRPAAQLRPQPAAVAVRARGVRIAGPGVAQLRRRHVSVLEATLDDPRPVLSAQQFLARGEAVAAMKSEGIEYDQRMELLEEVTHPKPLEELLQAAFDTYRASQPWVGDFELGPKSVVRDLYERAMTFNEYIGYYKLNRSEGLVLRYLSDAYRAAKQTIPAEAKSEDLLDLIEWLGELVRQVDSSLLDEWEELIHPTTGADGDDVVVPPAPRSILSNPRAFRTLVRNELFRRVQLAALERYDELGELDAASGFDATAWADALEPYFAMHSDIGTDADARSSAMLIIDEGVETWEVRQIFADPAGDHDWGISATIDLAESAEAGTAVVRVTAVGM